MCVCADVLIAKTILREDKVAEVDIKYLYNLYKNKKGIICFL